jgi:hypothetical protein
MKLLAPAVALLTLLPGLSLGGTFTLRAIKEDGKSITLARRVTEDVCFTIPPRRLAFIRGSKLFSAFSDDNQQQCDWKIYFKGNCRGKPRRPGSSEDVTELGEAGALYFLPRDGVSLKVTCP